MIPEIEWEVLRFLRRIDLSKCQLLSKSHNGVVHRYDGVLALLPLRHVDIVSHYLIVPLIALRRTS